MTQLIEEPTSKLEPIVLVEPDPFEIDSEGIAFEQSWHDDEPEVWSGPLWIARDECGVIEALEDGYNVRQPIPYEIEQVGEGDYLASFDEANIAIGGLDDQDAYQALIIEILNTFDTLTEEESHLSSAAARQLEILRTYIERT